MKNLRIIVQDDDGLLKPGSKHSNPHPFISKSIREILRDPSYQDRLKKYEGNFLEIGSYLIPGIRLSFLEDAEAILDTAYNISLSKHGKVRVEYKSENSYIIREIKSKGIFMRIDDPEKEFYKKTGPGLIKISERWNSFIDKLEEKQGKVKH